jgi:hypothetical protein
VKFAHSGRHEDVLFEHQSLFYWPQGRPVLFILLEAVDLRRRLDDTQSGRHKTPTVYATLGLRVKLKCGSSVCT